MPFAECSTAKDEHTEKGDQKDRWVKDLEMCLSMSPGVYHEVDLPGISLHSRILFGWRRTETVVCTMPGGKKGGEENVVSEIGHWILLGLAWEPWAGGWGGCGAVNSNLAMVLVGTALWRAVHQNGEPKLADELEKSAYMQTCSTSSRNNQVDFQK